jgi:CheY-like chemotaxis protein
VCDTGVGIPLDRQRRIFDAFTQVDGSTTRTHGGTGLGLTIAAQLVRLMGGRVWVESEVGRGSTFHFTATLAAASESAPALPDAVDLHNLAVLIVDDNATNRRLLQEMVVGWRMVPTLAVSAAEALTGLRAAEQSGRPFDLVLTDFQMPDADGFMLAREIRSDPRIADTIVIMLTAAGQPGDVARCEECGIAAYLPKPVRRSDLHRTILLAMTGTSADRPAPAVRVDAGATGRILLVEDNSVNQLVARRLLEKRGYAVVVANNGREALATLEATAFTGFDCVLMDVQMPEMDGFECTTRIRELERGLGWHLPIVAMTAHSMKGDEGRCLAAGMDGYVSKPIQADEFFEVIERLLLAAH